MNKLFSTTDPASILVTRRDNIGDMLCTTPLIRGIRRRYPEAHLAVLASSYNYDAIAGNGNVDEVFVFEKRQQHRGFLNYLRMLLTRMKLLVAVRSRKFDVIILANGGWRYARKLNGKKVIGFHDAGKSNRDQPDTVIPLKNGLTKHEVEKMAELGAVLDLDARETLGKMSLKSDPSLVSAVRERLSGAGWSPDRKTIGVHISSRRPRQRWPEEKFISLIRRLHTVDPELQFILLWSPGTRRSSMHPGDDIMAENIQRACAGLPLFPLPTQRVSELIASMECCDQFIGSDGGAMHVAAALEKPILCFFGDSHRAEWFPWGVPFVLLQPDSLSVPDISVDEAEAGFLELQGKLNP